MSPTSRSDVSSSAAVGSGGFGISVSTSPSSASTAATSSDNAFARRETSCMSAIASAASPPSFFARAIACEASFWRARRPSTSGSSSRRRASSANAASSRSSEPSPRRASAARAASGSRRIALRSIIDAYGVGGVLRSSPEYFAMKSAIFSASSPTTMFCGIGPEEKPPLRIA